MKAGKTLEAGKLVANFISFVVHPVFMPLYAVLLYFHLSTRYFLPQNTRFLIYYLIIVAIIIPLLFLWVLKRAGALSSFQTKHPRERLFFSVIMTTVYMIVFTKIIKYNDYLELYPFFSGISLSLFILMIYNYLHQKPSIHAMAIGGIWMFFMIWSYYTQIDILAYLSILFLLGSLVIASRLYLDAHNFTEIIKGLVIGMASQIVSFYFVLEFF